MRLKNLLAIGALLAALGASGGADAQSGKLRFYVNFIGGPEIQFFAVVKRGVEDAGRDLGVEAIYSAPKCCDINLQSQLLKSNVAAKPDGIAVEFNDPKALARPILDALDAKIPVILVNTQNFADESDPRIKALAYVGQDELKSGAKVGAGLLPNLKKGARVVCQNPGPAQIVQTIRCDGLKKFLEQELGATVDTLVNTASTPAQGLSVLDGYMRSHKDAAAIVSLNPETGTIACQWVEKNDMVGKVVVGGYDVSPAVLDCIKRGITSFTLVQQAYAQGYLAVVNLYLAKKYGMTPTNMDTGTLLVTKDNAADFQPVVDSGRGG
ncbi:MAG: substrate-binding domain-containing protein [Methylobacteriaceae bacterium]|nr:substrate-binding domain-containing protein [Methylobacteriaceae bacterium]MBV9220767.1 substrate-binding domain-containing protein [Methylobacteriaceae bacterium]MBV9244627.1 substrate-binding domain-containing protein [Methylobacteriaceae bacterium]